MIDANDLEAMTKARPDEKFLKGTGVLKLIGAIRQLERENRELSAALAASGQAVAPSEPSVLHRFYGVTTDAELIRAQARHIEKLQAKLPPLPSLASQRVREG